MGGENFAVGSLIERLKDLLARFASKELADEKACKRTGVLVKFNRKERNKIAFVFHTADKISVQVVFDLNKTSESYVLGMVVGVKEDIERKRKERSKSIIEIPSARLARAVTVASSEGAGI